MSKQEVFIGLALAAACVAALPAPAAAQDLQAQEVVVTGSRVQNERDNFADIDTGRPAVGVRRDADFLVQTVAIRGDTRDQEQRRTEIRAMLRQAVQYAARYDVELSYGDYVVTPLTLDTIDELAIRRDNRPDSELVTFLVKAKLGGEQTYASAQSKIGRYIEAVPENGRAQLDTFGNPALSVIGPDSYRYQITQEIAEDANRIADQLGPEYRVEITGLTSPVQWVQSAPGMVLLYLPYGLKIVPAS